MVSPARNMSVQNRRERASKSKATLARTSGVVRVGEDDGRGREVVIVADDGEEDTYTIPSGARLNLTASGAAPQRSLIT